MWNTTLHGYEGIPRECHDVQTFVLPVQVASYNGNLDQALILVARLQLTERPIIPHEETWGIW